MMSSDSKDTLLIDLQYLPSIAYFSLISQFDHVVLEAHEFFEKQTYRNRANLLASQQVETLTVPVLGANKKIRSKDMLVDNEQLWSNKHWRSIKTCYGKSPYFEFFADEFVLAYEQEFKYLWELNYFLLTKCLKMMRLKVELTESGSYQKELEGNVYDGRSLINPKRPHLLSKVYQAQEYTQNFGNTFEANLSVVDLIMNEGPNSFAIIKKSRA